MISVITDTNGTCGAVVFWTLQGHVHILDLRSVLEEAGLGDLVPQAPSNAEALRRSADAAARGKSVLIRSVQRGRWEAFAQNVSADADEDGGARLRLTSLALGGTDLDDVGPDGAEGWRVRSTDGLAGQAFAESVSNGFQFHADHLDASDVSSWLIRCAKAVGAVALRKAGGFYFVPADALPKWRQVVAALKLCSRCDVHEIPAQRSEECVQSVLSALREEADQAMRDAEEYLEGDVKSSRGVATQRDKIAALKAKLKRYASLLGAGLEDIEARTEDVDAAFVMALMVMERPA
jgi:hypothetical protein